MRRALLGIVSIVAAIGAAPNSRVKLPGSRADLARGQKLFDGQCALCHGPKGVGGRGPMLSRAQLPHAPDDKALVKVISEGIRGSEMPGAGAMSEHEVLQTAAYVRSLGKVQLQPVAGNPIHGLEVYRNKGCANCHAIHGEGGISAPDLAGIGASRSARYLRESLWDPGAAVPESYLLVTVVPKDGQAVTGVRINEDSFSIQLRDNAGRSHSFWKSEVTRVEKQQGKSPMPSYRDQLSETESTDLVAYLASLKETK